jgi:hypothetical protein
MIPAMRWHDEIVFEEHAASDGPFLCEESLEPVNFKDEAAYLAHLQACGLMPRSTCIASAF